MIMTLTTSLLFVIYLIEMPNVVHEGNYLTRQAHLRLTLGPRKIGIGDQFMLEMIPGKIIAAYNN